MKSCKFVKNLLTISIEIRLFTVNGKVLKMKGNLMRNNWKDKVAFNDVGTYKERLLKLVLAVKFTWIR
jgi:hypothetical protein